MRFSQPGSMLLGVAVVLTAAAPTHAMPDGAASGYADRSAMRGEALPSKHTLRVSDTGNSLSKRYYGSRAGALTILWNIGLKHWRPSKRIVASGRYRAGAAIVIPKLPKASINPPRRANQP